MLRICAASILGICRAAASSGRLPLFLSCNRAVPMELVFLVGATIRALTLEIRRHACQRMAINAYHA
jgi:hypothetical protein